MNMYTAFVYEILWTADCIISHITESSLSFIKEKVDNMTRKTIFYSLLFFKLRLCMELIEKYLLIYI